MQRNLPLFTPSFVFGGLFLLTVAFVLLLPSYASVLNIYIQSGFSEIRNAPLSLILIYVTSATYLLPSLFILGAIFLTSLYAGARRNSLGFLCGIITAYMAVLFFKLLFSIPRPPDALITETGFSFPSAHATVAIAYVASFYLWLKKELEKKSRLLTTFFGYLLIFLALAISLSRVYFGVHTFTDIIAGALLGAWVSFLVRRFL